MGIQLSDVVENIVGKEEIARYKCRMSNITHLLARKKKKKIYIEKHESNIPKVWEIIKELIIFNVKHRYRENSSKSTIMTNILNIFSL